MRLIHFWCDYKGRRDEEQARHQIAAESWRKAKQKGDWMTVAIAQERMRRNSRNLLREKKPLPYVRDIIDEAVSQARAMPNDLLVFTNEDICMSQDIAECMTGLGGWGSRKDFQNIPDRLTEETISKGHWHAGADLFFFTPIHWVFLRSHFPDMVYACQAWDLIMRQLIKEMGGVEVQNQIAHQDHAQWWVANRHSPANRHNRRNAERFFSTRNLPLA